MVGRARSRTAHSRFKLDRLTAIGTVFAILMGSSRVSAVFQQLAVAAVENCVGNDDG
jgi:hypothetical protein